MPDWGEWGVLSVLGGLVMVFLAFRYVAHYMNGEDDLDMFTYIAPKKLKPNVESPEYRVSPDFEDASNQAYDNVTWGDGNTTWTITKVHDHDAEDNI